MRPRVEKYTLQVRRTGVPVVDELSTYAGEIKVISGDSVLIKEDKYTDGTQTLVLLHNALDVLIVPDPVKEEVVLQ